jgi:hypothetical protein
VAFVRSSLNPWGNNASANEGHYYLTFYVALFLIHSIWEQVPNSKARDPKLEKYLDTVRRLEASFEGFSIKNIPRGENEHADLLAKSAAQGLPLPSEVFFETIKAPLVELMERAVLTISPVHSEDWRTEIISFLQGKSPFRRQSL